jgi:hypothetical protein
MLDVIGALVVMALLTGALTIFIRERELDREWARLAQRMEELPGEIRRYDAALPIAATIEAQLTRVVEALRDEYSRITSARNELTHVVSLAGAFRSGQGKGAIGQRSFEITQLTHSRNLLRLHNQIAGARDHAELRPLRVDAQKARLRMATDERYIEAELARQARRQLAGGGTGGENNNALAAGAAALGELIEAKSADQGEDVADLQAALRTLLELVHDEGTTDKEGE